MDEGDGAHEVLFVRRRGACYFRFLAFIMCSDMKDDKKMEK